MQLKLPLHPHRRYSIWFFNTFFGLNVSSVFVLLCVPLKTNRKLCPLTETKESLFFLFYSFMKDGKVKKG